MPTALLPGEKLTVPRLARPRVANPVSFVDAMIIMAACRRPVRFVMDHRIFRWPSMAMLPEMVTPEGLQSIVAGLRGEWR